VEPALLEAERALVDAVLAGLGARDRAVVLAADQTVRPVGPAAIGPVDDARRKAVTAALAEIGPGGATDLGRALEAGADALPKDAPAAMVIYVGDGWPTVGDGNAEEILGRLARRPGGAPRLGAVGVGPLVNRFALASLVRGSGPLLEVADSSDAARVAVELVAEALRPTVAGVEVKLGPEVERVYPRGARAIAAGDTAFAVGRLRGDVPREVVLAWRDAKGLHEDKRPVAIVRSPSEPDVARRWAAARVEEIALKNKGREAATDVALRAGLLTPWTGWLVGDSSGTYVPTSFPVRVLDLAAGQDVGFSADLATPRAASGTLSEAAAFASGKDDDDDALKAAVVAASQRVLDEAGAAMRACRDSRAALRPELAGALDIGLAVDGDGRPNDVKVRVSGGPDDEPLDRCVKVVVEGLGFPSSDLSVKIDVRRSIPLPPPRATLRARKCSPTSLLPMPLRRGVWKQRLDRMAAAQVYLDAKQTCELPTWTDRRALLELVLLQNEAPNARLGTATELDRAGEADAAGLLRRETVRRARTPEELRQVKLILLGEERYPAGVFKKRLRGAGDDKERLAVVRKFLAIAPHDGLLRRKLVALLEALGQKQELAEEVRRVRLDPFADATLLAEGASALRRIGAEAEARRAFGELAERAPRDPWARAFLGDRLRAEGWFDDATAAYAVLADLVPDEPAAALRVALAHAGGGRLDIAQRTLARVSQTGGRAGDATLGELAGHLAGVMLGEARQRKTVAPEDAERLARAAMELPRPGGATMLLVRAPASAAPITTTLVRGPREAREERQPDLAAPGLGIAALRVEAGDASEIVLRLKGEDELPPARPTRVRVDALVPDGAGKPPRVVTTDVDVPPNGKAVEVRWANGSWSAG
jgi:tetratricopeptide (TPR) repeat protein